MCCFGSSGVVGVGVGVVPWIGLNWPFTSQSVYYMSYSLFTVLAMWYRVMLILCSVSRAGG
jgi:hypothetical protein